jgi:hypothetical protein
MVGHDDCRGDAERSLCSRISLWDRDCSIIAASATTAAASAASAASATTTSGITSDYGDAEQSDNSGHDDTRCGRGDLCGYNE